MRFRVRYRKKDGQEEERVTEAASRFDIYAAAESGEESVLMIKELSNASFSLLKYFRMRSIPADQVIAFAKNLSAMLAAGLPLSRSLAIIIRQSGSAELHRVVEDIEKKVQGGMPFYEALRRHPAVFSELFVAMAKSGEESGTLAAALGVVARQMTNMHELVKRVRSAMIYPGIILGAVVVIGLFMLIFVVPTLASTFSELGVDLPFVTVIVVELSRFVVANVFPVIGSIVLIVAAVTFFLHSNLGARLFMRVALHLPVFGELMRETYSARAARTLSSLVASGVPLLTALSITEEVVGHPVFAQILNEACVRVQKGDALSTIFADHHDLYPYLFSDMILVGEESGKLAEMLGRVAEYYEADVAERTKDLSTILEPALMLFIGLLVGLFAVSMIGPIYSLTSEIG
jgi:type II secretory pathway component PulF